MDHQEKGCDGRDLIQQTEDFFYQPIGLQFKEETSKVLH
jgi:hypothetical protein